MAQTKPFTIAQYVNAGCWQLRDLDPIGVGLHCFTSGMMCNGCPHMNMGCAAFAKLNSASTETVRQEAFRRGVSINAVRRSRGNV